MNIEAIDQKVILYWNLLELWVAGILSYNAAIDLRISRTERFKYIIQSKKKKQIICVLQVIIKTNVFSDTFCF